MFGVRSLGRVLGFVAVCASPLLAAGPRREPFLVLSVRSIDQLLSGVRAVTGSKDASPADRFIQQVTRGKGLAGLDRAKPLGVCVLPGATRPPEEAAPDVIVLLPVKDTAAFLGLLGHPSPAEARIDDRVFNFASFGRNLFGKIARGYCFISEKRDLLEDPPAPGILGTRQDVSIELSFSRVPAELKETAIQDFMARWKDGIAALPARRNASYTRGHELGTRFVGESVESLLRDADRLQAGLSIEGPSRGLTLEWEVVARAGTELAASMDRFASASPSFGALLAGDAALSAVCSVPIPDIVREGFARELASEAEETRGRIDETALLSADSDRRGAHETLDGFLNGFQGLRELDFALILDSAPGGKTRLTAAGRVASGAAISKALENLVQVPGAAGPGELRLDVAKHAGGRIHALALPGELSRVFGSGPAHLAVRGDALFFSAGGDSLGAMKLALQATAGPAVRRPPVSVRLRFGKLFDLFGKIGGPRLVEARQSFQGRSDVAAYEVLPLQHGMKGRVTVGEGLVRLFAPASER